MQDWLNKRVSRRTVRVLVRGWGASAAGTLLIFAGVTAHGAWRDAPPVRSVRAAPAAHAPVQLAAAAAPGVTGTIALPPLPTGAVSIAATASAAALPFSVAAVGAVDRARAMECLTAAIYYEAASEPDEGQQAVAQVVLNRVRHPAFPGSVCGVVYQGSARVGCQFSFACDGAMARVPSRSGWARAARAAAAALYGRVYAPVGLATHYHTYAVTPTWNRSLVMTGAVGAHFFHRWKGWWGTPPAFAQRYRGGEPMPGPLAAPVSPQVAAAALPVPPLPAAGPTMATATSQAPPPAPAVALVDDRLAGSGQVLDRWKDTGAPLR